MERRVPPRVVRVSQAVRRSTDRQIHRFLAALWLLIAPAARSGEVLYNGIELPPEWPPSVDWEAIKPRKPLHTPPYAKRAPPVIPIESPDPNS